MLSYTVMLSIFTECAKYSTPTDVPSYGVQILRAYGGGRREGEDGGGRSTEGINLALAEIETERRREGHLPA